MGNQRRGLLIRRSQVRILPGVLFYSPYTTHLRTLAREREFRTGCGQRDYGVRVSFGRGRPNATICELARTPVNRPALSRAKQRAHRERSPRATGIGRRMIEFNRPALGNLKRRCKNRNFEHYRQKRGAGTRTSRCSAATAIRRRRVSHPISQLTQTAQSRATIQRAKIRGSCLLGLRFVVTSLLYWTPRTSLG